MATLAFEAFGIEDPSAATRLREALAAAGLDVVESGAPAAASVALFDQASDALFEAVAAGSHSGRTRVVAVDATPHGASSRVHWQLLRAGAEDVLRMRDAGRTAAELAARVRRWADVDALVDSDLVRANLVGGSTAWRAALRQIVEAAAFSDAPVLLLGESGTGKELAARLVHSLDRRRGRGEIVLVDCTTITADLAGSELFGHERGAFTGAAEARDGALALADGGTLFLDEVGELPLALQPRFLRAVQERTYKRVGGNAWRTTKFRLVCATHRDLAAEVGRGAFRGDLYHRLAATIVRLPPLRERQGDVELLAGHFLARHAPDGVAPELVPAVREHLTSREYPGNVRDLEQLVGRIARRHVGPGPVTLGALPEDERVAAAGAGADGAPGAAPAAPEVHPRIDRTLDEAVEALVRRGGRHDEIRHAASDAAKRAALAMENDNVRAAAARLDVRQRTLQVWRKRGRA